MQPRHRRIAVQDGTRGATARIDRRVWHRRSRSWPAEPRNFAKGGRDGGRRVEPTAGARRVTFYTSSHGARDAAAAVTVNTAMTGPPAPSLRCGVGEHPHER